MAVPIRYWPLMVSFLAVSFSSFLAFFTSAWAVIFNSLVAELVAEISTWPLDSTLAFLPILTVALASLSSTRTLIFPKKVLAPSESFLPALVPSIALTILLATLLSSLAAESPSFFSSVGALNTLPVNLVVALAEISVSPPLTLPLIFTVADAWAACRFNREALSALAWLRSMVLLFSALITTLFLSASTVEFSPTVTALTPWRIIEPSSSLDNVSLLAFSPITSWSASPTLVISLKSMALRINPPLFTSICPAMSFAAYAVLIFPSTEIVPLLLAGISATRVFTRFSCSRNLVIFAFLSKILVVLLLEPSLLELMDFMIFFM